MKAIDVLRNIDILFKTANFNSDEAIEYLSEDTKDIKENTCFICIKGQHVDSHDLVNTFSTKPVLIIAERQIDTDIPYVIIHDTKKHLPQICYNFFENPSKNVNLIGITGTDGKTTTALVLKQLIDQVKTCAYMGTNGFQVGKQTLNYGLTTPKPIQLNQFISDLIHQDVHYATLEVSSQGLDLHRVNNLTFKVAIFTNLTHEHLDHHKTIENYFLSKLKLFQMLDEESFAVVNLDSEPYGRRIIKETKAKTITYGKNEQADFRISNIRTQIDHTLFDLITPMGIYKDIKTNLFGDYNVYNITASLCATFALGFELENLFPIIANLQGIDGRMVIINQGQPFNVIVDFAHTPNALNCLLSNLSKFKTNNLSVIFGSAGERDKTKRPKMGEIVEKYASQIIITNEDPKSEEPLDIILDIYKGIKNTSMVKIIPNRKEAIIKTLDEAKTDDIVVITGKGNEKYQVFNNYLIDHNDIDIASTFLKNKYQYIYSIANM